MIDLALIPSCQPFNIGVIKGYTEERGMWTLAQLVKSYANTFRDFECESFWAGSEGASTTFPLLREQHRLADVWLYSKPKTDIRLVLDLHTDAFAGVSHVAACYGLDPGQTEAQSESWKLVMAVASSVNVIFQTEIKQFNYSDHIFYASTQHISSLFEVCAHDNLSDLTKLFANFDAVAKAIVHGVLRYAGRSLDIPSSTPAPLSPEVAITIRRNMDTIVQIASSVKGKLP